MGVVYLAKDPRLDRQVAIKVLPPDLTRDTTAKQRFLQEAKAASALDHPNICNIHEINETADGQLYLVMAHYEGETLKERIARGPLPLDDAIDIASQVGQGLAKAHAAGIVHRDIKPANLMVTTDGTVKILDFGLAKLAGSEGVTQTGTTVGTVAYMSPEQARGEEVDHRTDIWSLGVVLYETLSRQQPFQGDNLLAIAKAILESPTPTLTGAAAALNGVLGRALSKSESLRYQAATELLDELRSASSPATQATSLPDVPSIAVLPFADMSPKKDQDYFCEGMAEEIINALTKLEGLKVASRTSAFQFKGQSQDIRRIGEALNVTTVLEGSVRTSGNRLRVTVQLTDIADGYQVWSERYDRQMEDVFDIQDEISQAIANALKIRLVSDAAGPKVARHTEDVDAYHLYLRGRHHWFTSRYRGGLERAVRYFEQAIEQDTSYPLAHAGLAQAYSILGMYGFLPSKVAFPKAKAAVSRAFAGHEDVAEAHTASGMIRMVFDCDWQGADEQFGHAIALEPADTLALCWRALNLAANGQHRGAMSAARRAQELDPLSAYVETIAGHVLMLGRRYDEARDVLGAVLKEDPNLGYALWVCGSACSALGMHDEAVTHLRTVVRLSDRLPMYLGMLGQAHARKGERATAEALLQELSQRAEDEYVPPLMLGLIAMACGDADRGFECLEQEYQERGILLYCVTDAWFFDDFRTDPRFQALLRRLNFPATAASS